MNRQEHLLTIASEECAELAQRISKALRFGVHEVQPGQDKTNAERISYELADLLGVVGLLIDDGIDIGVDSAMVEAKKEKVKAFLLTIQHRAAR